MSGVVRSAELAASGIVMAARRSSAQKARTAAAPTARAATTWKIVGAKRGTTRPHRPSGQTAKRSRPLRWARESRQQGLEAPESATSKATPHPASRYLRTVHGFVRSPTETSLS